VVPFKQRVSVLHAHLDYDKTQYFSSQEHGGAARLGLTGALRIEVRRDALVADAYDQLSEVGPRLKGMVKVEFISEQGLNEAGIDGGGLFKEFIDSFAKEAFSPTYGLFIPTSHQLLTPNPASAMLGSNHLRYFNFVGKILGKSMYEVSLRLVITVVVTLPSHHVWDIAIEDPAGE
jgi:ubiquitin-protein ligase E3 C